MTGIHLNHKIYWSDAIRLFTFPKDPGVELTMGYCNKIHINNKDTEIKIKNRSYLTNQICINNSCKIVGKRKFYKSSKETIDLGKFLKIQSIDDILLVKQLINSIIDFSRTERNKYKRKVYLNKHNNKILKDIIEDIKKKYNWFKPEDEILFDSCLCWLFNVLIEIGDIETLLSFTDDQIKKVFCCLHGGQAVGNNTNYLIYHIIKTYIFTNLIYASGSFENNENWGIMKPDSYFRNNLMFNCDGQTFLYQSRKYLINDIYIKDLVSMRKLCKDCFRFIYILYMIRVEVYGNKESEDWMKNQIKNTI
jgi:hypothetical protein